MIATEKVQERVQIPLAVDFELPVEFPETRDLVPEILAFLDSVWQVHLREHR